MHAHPNSSLGKTKLGSQGVQVKQEREVQLLYSIVIIP